LVDQPSCKKRRSCWVGCGGGIQGQEKTNTKREEKREDLKKIGIVQNQDSETRKAQRKISPNKGEMNKHAANGPWITAERTKEKKLNKSPLLMWQRKATESPRVALEQKKRA